MLVLADNSNSLLNYKNFNSIDYKKSIENFKTQLSDKFDVEINTFSKNHSLNDTINFNGKISDISLSLSQSIDFYSNDNLKNIVLLTDGVYNNGSNPAFLNNLNSVEINSVLYGDTTSISDAKIISLDYNPLVFFDEITPITVNLAFENLNLKNASCHIYEIDNYSKLIDSKNSFIKNSNFFESLTFNVKPTHKGINHYKIEIESFSNEINLANNTLDIYIEVVDGKKNVMILAQGPHPDISAIKTSLESNKSFNLSIKYADQTTMLPDNLDLLILHQLPSSTLNIENILKQANTKNLALLYILSPRTNYNLLNNYQSIINYKVISNSLQDYSLKLNQNFNNFVLTDNAKAKINNFPPLDNLLFETHISKDLQPFLFQKIGNVETTRPLISFSNTDYQSIGIISAENIWRWRLMDFKINNNTEVFDELISKTINYLAIKKSKKQLLISMAKQVYSNNEPINIKAIVYNKSFQPINYPEVNLDIRSNNGVNKKYGFISNGNSYDLNLGNLNVGDYSINIETNIDGKKLNETKKFSVFESNFEKNYSKANYEDINTLCIKNNGLVYLPNNINLLIEKLKSKEYKNLLIQQNKQLLPIDIFAILTLILILLSCEWILRKYYATY